MSEPSHELAYRTAFSAGPYAASLAFDCSQIAQAMREGAMDEALETFESTTGRLARFLTYLLVTSELLGDTSPSLGAVVADYGRRLLEREARVEGALQVGDLVEFGQALEHGLGPALGDYRNYAADIARVLAPRATA